MKSPKNNKKQIEKIIKKQVTRVEVTKKSHLWFFHTYLSDYVQHPIADLHKEMFAITEDKSVRLAVLCSFRGSGKSTLMSLSYPIWAILGKQQRKFIVLISQTAEQARSHFRNLRKELETNELLKRDLGPFQEMDEWNNCSLVIPRYNAKIIAVSKEQSFRGIRHGRYRPDLIVADDIENSDSVKTQESRDATYKWFTSEVLPLGDKNTKIIIAANLLHQDSLVMRLKNEIEDGRRTGIFRKYPLLDEDNGNKIAWEGKYPDMQAIEEEKLKVGNIYAWCREYLLRIVDDREPVIQKSWIQYYDKLPKILKGQSYCYVTGIDPALGAKDTNDPTAMVNALVIGEGEKQEIYILPYSVNGQMGLSKMIETVKDIRRIYGDNRNHRFYVEEVALQGHITSALKREGINAIGVPIHTKDKRTRLELTGVKIHKKQMKFPRHGCEGLLGQAIEFGTAKHDDLVDALSTLSMGLDENPPNRQGVMIVKSTPLVRERRRDGGDWADREDRKMFNSLKHHPRRPGKNSSIEFGPDGLPRRKY
jgi:phage terminase large subunit-like protein